MASPAMAEALDKIGAAIPLVALVGMGFVRIIVNSDHIPDRKGPALAFYTCNFRWNIGLVNWLDFFHEKTEKCTHVLLGHLGIGRVGHCRVETMTVACDTCAHHTIKFFEGVLPD